MLNKILFFLLYIFCLFPYIRIIPINTDTQPNALVISIIILILNYKIIKSNFKKEFLILFVLVSASIIVTIFSGINFNSFRSLFNYVSIFCIPVAVYIMFKHEKMLNEKLIKASIIIMALVGVIQKYIMPDFLDFLLLRSSTSSTRGVTSLTTEPTFYGVVCLFYLLLALRFNSKKNVYIFIIVFQIIFLAQSSMATIMLITFVLVFIITKNAGKFKFIPIAIIVLVALMVIYNIIEFAMPDSRLFNHLSRIIKEPFQLLFKDESISQRSSSVFFSIKGCITNIGLPRGFNTFQEFMEIEKLYNTIPFSSIAGGSRIMSGIGACLYEMGIFGGSVIYIIIKSLKVYLNSRRESIAITVCVLFTMFMAVTIGMPIFNFILGYGIYLREDTYKKQ